MQAWNEIFDCHGLQTYRALHYSWGLCVCVCVRQREGKREEMAT